MPQRIGVVVNNGDARFRAAVDDAGSEAVGKHAYDFFLSGGGRRCLRPVPGCCYFASQLQDVLCVCGVNYFANFECLECRDSAVEWAKM